MLNSSLQYSVNVNVITIKSVSSATGAAGAGACASRSGGSAAQHLGPTSASLHV